MKHYTTTHNNYNNLMWSKTPIISPMNSFIISSSSPWQEHNNYQEPFGGLAWPPRSYTCTFCRREFRSAQALGGHMNVHRRDRARLKHSSPPPQPHQTDPILHHHQDHTSADSCPENILSHKENGSNDDDLVETKLSMGIDLVDPGNVVCKRHKKSSSSSTVSSSPLPFLHTKPCSSSMEDIDLELRLGDPPAVK